VNFGIFKFRYQQGASHFLAWGNGLIKTSRRILEGQRRKEGRIKKEVLKEKDGFIEGQY
jgi:hypothetical protein